MDVFDGIRTLLAVRHYQDRPVPDAVIRKILEAGRLTGSAMNLQPWHFIVVQDLFMTATAELADVVLPALVPGVPPRGPPGVDQRARLVRVVRSRRAGHLRRAAGDCSQRAGAHRMGLRRAERR